MSSTAMANDDVYSFVALDLSKLENNIFESDNYINFSYSPSITIGFAKDYQLYDDWLLTNSVGIRATSLFLFNE